MKAGKKHVGKYYPEQKLFTKTVKRSKHLFRVLNAWGIDNKVLETLPNNVIIVIRELEGNKEYSTTAGYFKEKGQFYHFKNAKNDFGVQKFLKLSEFDIL